MYVCPRLGGKRNRIANKTPVQYGFPGRNTVPRTLGTKCPRWRGGVVGLCEAVKLNGWGGPRVGLVFPTSVPWSPVSRVMPGEWWESR